MSDAKTLVGIAVAFTIISSLVANNFGAMLGGLVVFLAGLFFLVVLVSYLVEKVRNRPGPRLHIYNLPGTVTQAAKPSAAPAKGNTLLETGWVP